MDQEGVPAAVGSGDDVDRLIALTERQHDLWALLRDATDETTRNQLFDELSANRQELAKLKEKVSAELDPGRVAAPPGTADPDPPRSVGEELRAKILTPDYVAPAVPPPPPPPTVPPPVVEEPQDRYADAIPIEEAESGDENAELSTSGDIVDAERVAPADEPRSDEDSEQATAVERPLVSPGGLAPETTPFSSREADLAAMRAHRERTSASQAADRSAAEAAPESEAVSGSEPEPEPASSPAPPTERSAAPPQERVPAADPRAREEEQTVSAHATFQDLDKVRPKHSRSFPVFAVVVAVLAVAAVVWMLFFWQGGDSGTDEPPATTTTVEAAPDASPTGQIRAVLDGLGLSAIAVEERSGTIFLVGIVAS